MEFDFNDYNLHIFETKNCLVVPIQLDLYDQFLVKLQEMIVKKLVNTSLLGVVIDISAITIIDSINLTALIQLCELIHLMGKKAVIIGFQPGVASALAEISINKLNKLITFLNLEAAIKYLTKDSYD